MNILQKIVVHKREEILKKKIYFPFEQLKDRVKIAENRFYQTLKDEQTSIKIIAECKQKSPSKGLFTDTYDPVSFARAYQAGGALAISVLTDKKFFAGSKEDLSAVVQAVHVPVLCKDFILDAYQIFEARYAGAESYLLIVKLLDQETLESFLELGRSLGMEALVEVHTKEDLTKAIRANAKIIGINARHLETFSTNLEYLVKIYREIERRNYACQVVAESGIRTPDDLKFLKNRGIQRFLIGETFMRVEDKKQALESFLRI